MVSAIGCSDHWGDVSGIVGVGKLGGCCRGTNSLARLIHDRSSIVRGRIRVFVRKVHRGSIDGREGGVHVVIHVCTCVGGFSDSGCIAVGVLYGSGTRKGERGRLVRMGGCVRCVVHLYTTTTRESGRSG
jgi:hypothetical protein